VPELRRVLADVAEPARSALLALPELYGGPEVLDAAAARLPQDAEITALLDELRRLAAALADLPVSFDLADLRGYHYHSGVVFAAYGADSPAALALGGRYDRVGQAFGRARPAVGFSLDLRELVWRLPTSTAMAGAVLAPLVDDAALAEEVALLRARGEIVVTALPGHDGTWNEAGCDRQLVKRGDRWAIVSLQGE
jgi:ATP phosphoribosyltransferase regulatory subunit